MGATGFGRSNKINWELQDLGGVNKSNGIYRIWEE
jgi:hypothetical protein